MEGYQLFVVDTFSKIHGNLEKDARNNQNKCMEELQELAQRLDVAIVMLHHTNRAGTWEGSQKIMDLSNVFIVITKMDD
jgi:RecA-family ATPase